MMFVFTILISRMVPLLFFFSAILVVGRFLHDRYRQLRPSVANGVFAGVLVVGMIGATPFMLRSTSLVAAEFWVSLGRWEKADHNFQQYLQQDGKLDDALVRDWATVLMNLERWEEAEKVLLASVRMEGEQAITTPNTIYLLGICRFYQGRWGAAETTFSAVADSPIFFLKSYYLGRLTEFRGDTAGATAHYLRCLEAQPDLLAPLYQAVRLLLELEEYSTAAIVIDEFKAGGGPYANDPLLVTLEEAVRNGDTSLPEVEFRVVQFQG